MGERLAGRGELSVTREVTPAKVGLLADYVEGAEHVDPDASRTVFHGTIEGTLGPAEHIS